MDEELKKKLDSQDFYELCQEYRWSRRVLPHPNMPTPSQAFERIKDYLLTGKLPWPSYETSAD